MPAALITGGDSGIGRAAAVILAEQGWEVGITYRTDEVGARETAEEIEGHGRRAVVRQLDVREFSEVPRALQEMAGELGGLDLFVNNAALGIESPFLELSLEDWQTVIDTNLTGAFVAAQAAARLMVERGEGGAIVNVTSIHEHVPLMESSAYASSKGGIGLLTKAMALELAEHKITVNAVAPGEIATPMTDQHHSDPSDADRPGIPWKRPGHAREIGAWIAFLGSPEARYATGSSFVVDGGMTLTGATANREE